MNTFEFDYVIVGAGSAGCVLADRLTQCGRFQVLLLESGGSDAQFWIKVPIGYAINVTKPALNWGYTTAPDPELNGRLIDWPRGKVVGGSSSINAMAYVRGLPRDFDDWAKAGARNWNWDVARQTYDRLETHSYVTPQGRKLQGDGPIWVSDLSDQMSSFSKYFLDAAREAGHQLISDMNLPNSDGISYYRSTVRNGYRWSSADAFLRPAKRRSNLTILCNAEVDQILLKNYRTTGAIFTRREQRYKVDARKEVILCAGAINSPKLLQLSGVGPAELLRRYDISIFRDLPWVGKGLQDHLAVSFQFRTNRATLNNTLGRPFGKLLAGARYILNRKGPLSVPVNQVGGFVKSDHMNPVPDIQIYCNPASYEFSKAGKVVLDRFPGYQISAQPCRPTSTGAIEIISPLSSVPPRINPRSLSTEEDKAAAIRAGRVLQKLARSASLQAVTTSAKSPDLRTLDDDALLEDFRSRASTVYHPTSTCRMGRTDQDSVLDYKLRVHGVQGLRVVDASAFPNITSGNTNAPTMMLAMRAADLILEDAR